MNSSQNNQILPVRHPLSKAIALLAMLAVFLALPARAGYSSLCIFGDSLSAVSGGGFQYPPPPGDTAADYWDGRFSNGQIWAEYFAAQQGIPFDTNQDFSNFGDDSSEVYLNIVYGNYYPKADIATSLYVYWPACSDCFVLALFDFTNSWAADIQTEMTNTSACIDILYSQGMRSIVIPNAVDVSLVPFFAITLPQLAAEVGETDPPSYLNDIHNGVIQYNTALASNITYLRAQYPGLTIFTPDFYTQFNNVVSKPASFGLTKTTIDALEDTNLVDKSFTGAGANYVFWDYLHPTTKVHAIIATVVEQSMAPGINAVTLNGANARLELVNLPIGGAGSIESTSDLAHPNWTSRASINVTNSVQSFSIPTNGVGSPCFFRLNFPK